MIAAFSILLNGVEALGSFLTPSDSSKGDNFYVFIKEYKCEALLIKQIN